MTVSEPGTIELHLASELRNAVLDEIRRSSVEVEDLAERLNVNPVVLAAILDRDHWPLQTGLRLAEGLVLDVKDFTARLQASLAQC